MKRTKGVVMKVSGNKTVIVTSEGDFLEIPTPKGQCPVGQVIEVDLSPKKSFLKRSVIKYAAAAAVLFLVLALALLNSLFAPGSAAAYVALDIQDGVELQVNQEGKIIEVRDVSEGVSKLQGESELKGRDVYQAVELILQEASAKGILEKDQNLVLASVVPVSDKGVNVVDEVKLRGIIRKEMLDKKVTGYVMVGKANVNIKHQAESQGMTVNNYLVYERCRKGGLGIKADAFRGGDIRKILSGANTSLPGLFPNECFAVGESGHLGTMGTDAERLGNSKQIMEQVCPVENNNSTNEMKQPGLEYKGYQGGKQNDSGQQGVLIENQGSYNDSNSLGGQGYRYSGGIGKHRGP